MEGLVEILLNAKEFTLHLLFGGDLGESDCGDWQSLIGTATSFPKSSCFKLLYLLKPLMLIPQKITLLKLVLRR